MSGRAVRAGGPLTEGKMEDLLKALPPTSNVYKYDKDGVLIARRSNENYPESDFPDLENETYVRKVNLKIDSNIINHHTDKYNICSDYKCQRRLVVRRGQTFSIDVELSRHYDDGSNLSLVFGVGNKPTAGKGTYVEINLSEDARPHGWNAKVVSSAGNSITIDISIPPNCVIGKWNFAIDSITSNNRLRYENALPIYIIFNPWCKDDTVHYVANARDLDEYVLNETGMYYHGTFESTKGSPWYYGQFQSNVLDQALSLLDLAGLEHHYRNNPILVIRKVSAVVNDKDENGVIVGNNVGNEDYSDGTNPSHWNSSVTILDKYFQTRNPVKYGRCWVFACVANTLARTLGIPCRVVTNFSSGFEKDKTYVVDRYLNYDGELLEAQDDHIWDFHVWNEAYMARPDLPSNYGGWQAFDATPKQTSDGVHCCGPASVAAIKSGDVHLKYDGETCFSDVNGDVYFWKPDPRNAWILDYEETDCVGKLIGTKSLSSDKMEIITDNYKYKEGSSEERAAVKKAVKKLAPTAATVPKIYKSAMSEVNERTNEPYMKRGVQQDVKFNVEVPSNGVNIGSNCEVSIKMKNSSKERRTVEVQIVMISEFQSGKPGDTIKKENLSIALQPGEEKVQKFTVTQEDYVGKLKTWYFWISSFQCKVLETGQKYRTVEKGRFLSPKLRIKAPAEVQLNKEFSVEFSFDNPLNQTLTNCMISISGISSKMLNLTNVAPKETFKKTLSFVPTRTGKEVFVVAFNSDLLNNVTGDHQILVKEA